MNTRKKTYRKYIARLNKQISELNPTSEFFRSEIKDSSRSTCKYLMRLSEALLLQSLDLIYWQRDPEGIQIVYAGRLGQKRIEKTKKNGRHSLYFIGNFSWYRFLKVCLDDQDCFLGEDSEILLKHLASLNFSELLQRPEPPPPITHCPALPRSHLNQQRIRELYMELGTLLGISAQ